MPNEGWKDDRIEGSFQDWERRRLAAKGEPSYSIHYDGSKTHSFGNFSYEQAVSVVNNLHHLQWEVFKDFPDGTKVSVLRPNATHIKKYDAIEKIRLVLQTTEAFYALTKLPVQQLETISANMDWLKFLSGLDYNVLIKIALSDSTKIEKLKTLLLEAGSIIESITNVVE
jgi:hypothetical protein